MVKVLISFGADINVVEARRYTCLHWAALHVRYFIYFF